jgi:hypothetical protein
MSSVLRYTKEPTPISKHFTVFPYYGVPSGGQEYYFTVENNSLFRIEADLSGAEGWVVARDMGTTNRITTIDPELIEYWENGNGWSNIQVVRPGFARKYQALAIPVGNNSGSLNNGPGWNNSAYTDPNGNLSIPYYNSQYTGINDLLQMGYGETTTFNNYNQNLPFATFYAVVDPVIIRYENGGQTYTRAIVNRVTPC